MAVRRLWRVLVAGIPLGGVSVLFFRSRLLLYSVSVALTLGACQKSSSDSGTVRDDFGEPVRIGAVPKRIASLNPATTEILFTLGAGSRLIGRTKYDLWPDSAPGPMSVRHTRWSPHRNPTHRSLLGCRKRTNRRA